MMFSLTFVKSAAHATHTTEATKAAGTTHGLGIITESAQ